MTTSNADAARFIGELESSLWVEDRTGQGSSAAIFDAGREGLDFFADFGPLYARYRGGAFDLDRDIVARYDRQREIAFGKLHADAERLRALCAAMSENSLDFRDAAAPVFGSWQGSAADAAKEHLDGMLHSAGSTWSRLATLASTIDTAADAAERIAVDKARAVRALALSHVGGLAAGEVALLVTAATAGDSLTDAQLLDLASLCDLEISPAACRTDRDLLNQVGTDVRGWLDHAFVPVYETRAEAFEAACAAAESDLAGTWDTLRSALAAVGEGSIAAAEASRTSAASQPPAAAASQLPVAAASQAGEGGAAAPVPAGTGPGDPPAGGHLGPGAQGGSGDGVGIGRSGTGVQPGAGPQPGAGGQVEPGAQPGSGSGAQPGAGPQPGAGGEIAPGVQPGPGGQVGPGARVGAEETDMMAMGAAPPAAAAPAAVPGVGRGGPVGPGYQQFFPLGGFGAHGGGGGDRDHQRKVTITGEILPADLAPASIPDLLGAVDDDEPVEPAEPPPPEPEPAPADKVDTFWELGEDGELRCVTKPTD